MESAAGIYRKTERALVAIAIVVAIALLYRVFIEPRILMRWAGDNAHIQQRAGVIAPAIDKIELTVQYALDKHRYVPVFTITLKTNGPDQQRAAVAATYQVIQEDEWFRRVFLRDAVVRVGG